MGRIFMRWVVMPMIVGTVIFFLRLGCAVWTLSHAEASHEAERTIDEPYREAAETFAKAIQKKDYPAAWALLSTPMRKVGTVSEFARAFHNAAITSWKVRPVSKDVSDDIFLAKELRPHIREVVAIDLDGPELDIVLVLYFIEEIGEPRVARFLID